MNNKQIQRNRTGSDIPAHMAAADPSLGDFTREQIAHGENRKPRVPMNVGDYNLSVPDGTIPSSMIGYWFRDDGKGRIENAKAAWWEHVTDSQGVNIVRTSGTTKMYLMAIDKKYYDEDEALREKNYRASIGETEEQSFSGNSSISSYTPEGESSKIRVTSDPFA